MEVVTESERPDLEAECRAAFRGNWPEFIFHDAVTSAYLDRTQSYFPRLDILLLDEGRVMAGGWGVALSWDGNPADLPDGYDGALVRAVEGHEAGVPVNTLCLMAIAVSDKEKRRGLAGTVIVALRERGAEQRLVHVIAPVRPTLKPRYPLATMERFATWRRPDGQHLDPWVRTHVRMGAKISERHVDHTSSADRWPSGSSGPAWPSPTQGRMSSPERSASFISTATLIKACTRRTTCGWSTPLW